MATTTAPALGSRVLFDAVDLAGAVLATYSATVALHHAEGVYLTIAEGTHRGTTLLIDLATQNVRPA
jgi:hypothetical protein